MQVLAPPDIEARFGLTGGHIFHGELVPEQAFDMRPVPGLVLLRGADRRLVPLRLRRLAGRLRDGRARPQRGARGHCARFSEDVVSGRLIVASSIDQRSDRREGS